MKALLFLAIFVLANQKEKFLIENIENKYLNVSVLQFENSDLLIESEYTYKYIIYNKNEYIDLNILKPHIFYVFIESTANKPEVRFFSLTAEKFDPNQEIQEKTIKQIEYKNNHYSFQIPLEQYQDTSILKTYFKNGTTFFDYLKFPKNSNFKVKLLYILEKECSKNILSSNTILIET